jgi:hypothetical protein
MIISLNEWLRLASIILPQWKKDSVSSEQAQHIFEECGFHIINEVNLPETCYNAKYIVTGYEIEVRNNKRFILAKLKYGITEQRF